MDDFFFYYRLYSYDLNNVPLWPNNGQITSLESKNIDEIEFLTSQGNSIIWFEKGIGSRGIFKSVLADLGDHSESEEVSFLPSFTKLKLNFLSMKNYLTEGKSCSDIITNGINTPLTLYPNSDLTLNVSKQTSFVSYGFLNSKSGFGAANVIVHLDQNLCEQDYLSSDFTFIGFKCGVFFNSITNSTDIEIILDEIWVYDTRCKL